MLTYLRLASTHSEQCLSLQRLHLTISNARPFCSQPSHFGSLSCAHGGGFNARNMIASARCDNLIRFPRAIHVACHHNSILTWLTCTRKSKVSVFIMEISEADRRSLKFTSFDRHMTVFRNAHPTLWAFCGGFCPEPPLNAHKAEAMSAFQYA